jgi:hypothetical protein
MEERRFHPLDYLSVLQRRKWWFIVPMALAVIVGVTLACSCRASTGRRPRSASPIPRSRQSS